MKKFFSKWGGVVFFGVLFMAVICGLFIGGLGFWGSHLMDWVLIPTLVLILIFQEVNSVLYKVNKTKKTRSKESRRKEKKYYLTPLVVLFVILTIVAYFTSEYSWLAIPVFVMDGVLLTFASMVWFPNLSKKIENR